MMRLHIAAATLLSALLARADLQVSGLEFSNTSLGSSAIILPNFTTPNPLFAQSFPWDSKHSDYNPTLVKLYINGLKVASSSAGSGQNGNDTSRFSVTLNPTSAPQSQSGFVQVTVEPPNSTSGPLNFSAELAHIMFLELSNSNSTTYTRAFTFALLTTDVPEDEGKYYTNTSALFFDNSSPLKDNVQDQYPFVLLNPTNTQDRNASAVASDAPPLTKSTLSAGAIAGIVVGCAVAVILMTVLAWWLLRRHRRRAEGLVSYNRHGNHTQDLIAGKGVTTGIEISPHSPYSDDGTSAATSLPAAAAIPSNSTHHSAHASPSSHPLQPLHPHAHATGHDARYIMAPVLAAAAVGGGSVLATTALAPVAPPATSQNPMSSPIDESAPPYSRFPNPSAAISVGPSDPRSSRGTATSDAASAYTEEGVAAPPPAHMGDVATADTDRPDGLVVSRSSTSCSVPSHYCHLVQDGMTPEQIRTLMDEERIIDEAIQQAERRS